VLSKASLLGRTTSLIVKQNVKGESKHQPSAHSVDTRRANWDYAVWSKIISFEAAASQSTGKDKKAEYDVL
jgi:hypothetical protein